MGSHFKALTVNMKTFLLALTLLMLGLHGSKADKVTSCLQCTSATGMENSECIKGTGKGTACGTDAIGCTTNNCNTMDPRTGSGSTTTTSNSGSTTDSSSSSTLMP